MADSPATRTMASVGSVMGDGGQAMGGPAMATPSMAPARPNGALGITSIGESLAAPTTMAVTATVRTYERYRVSVKEYVTFHPQGFFIVRGLILPEDIAELAGHVDDLIFGRIDVPGLEPPPPGASVAGRSRSRCLAARTWRI